MSLRVVGYEGEGRRRRPIYANEGPAATPLVWRPGQAFGGGQLAVGEAPKSHAQLNREYKERKRARAAGGA